MVRIQTAFWLAALLVAAAGGIQGQEGASRELAARIDSFLRETADLDEQARTRVLAIWNPVEADSLGEVLAAGWPAYAAAVSQADRRQAGWTTALEPFAEDADRPVIAADACWNLARSLVGEERFEEALPWLVRLTGELGEWSAHRAEAQYYVAACLLGMLRSAEADAALVTFLEQFPEAPERLRVSAWRQLEELRAVAGNAMAPVTARMEYSRRRLDIAEPGEETRAEQEEIVRLLGKMIEESEKKECSSGQCKKSGQQQRQAQNQPRPPQQNSKSQTGGQSNVANGEAVDRRFEGDASPWSRLRDRSRDPANAAIREKLPARYREIVERYTDAVSGNDDGKK